MTSSPCQPEAVAMLTKRKIKKLTKEKIEKFKVKIVSKTCIDLSNRSIETIVSFEGLEKATKVDLSCNRLTKLCDFHRLRDVTFLNLDNNKLHLQGLGELQQLNKMVTLHIAHNKISRLTKEVLRPLQAMKALILNDNSIQCIDWLPRLPELRSLVLSSNHIANLEPLALSKLPNLVKLSLSHNEIDKIPDLSAFPALSELRLPHNKIQDIPVSLAKNQMLKILDVGHNLIDNWEGIETLGSLQYLKQLNLRGNPITGTSQSESTEGISVEKRKELDRKNKLYNHKMKRIFPELVIRDGERIKSKKTYGYEGTEEKKPKRKRARQQEVAVPSEVEIATDMEDKQDRLECTTKQEAQDASASKSAEQTLKSNDESKRKDNLKGPKRKSLAISKKDAKKSRKEAKQKRTKAAPDAASGVIAVTHFRKARQSKSNLTAAFTSEITAMPSVGLGGESSWD